MDEERLYQICIVLAAVGIGLIYASSVYLEPELVKINEIQRSQQGQKITLQGNVTDFYTAKGHTFLTLKDSTASIEIVKFNDEKSLNDTTNVEIEGRISMYEGKMEIIAEEIRES